MTRAARLPRVAGFAMLETGSVRQKNSMNILIKNLLDVCSGAVALVHYIVHYIMHALHSVMMPGQRRAAGNALITT